jgi:glycerol kinase
MKRGVIALDQGTTSSRAILFDESLNPVASSHREFSQHFPQSGWVEHDANEILTSQLMVLGDVMAEADALGFAVAGLGITNQRETTVIWSRKTGQPIARALVWQDRRTEPWCKIQRDAGMADNVHRRTGLVLDPYFSASKIVWLLDNVPGARAQAEQGDLAFGTIDTWLIWHLTGGQVHATDETNASRTMLFNIDKHDWDDTLMARWHIPKSLMPQVRASADFYGETDAALLGRSLPIAGVAGDQQAALFGQGCVEPGQIKNTYGTGCFMLMHTGALQVQSRNGLITTAAASTSSSLRDSRSEIKAISSASSRYALEGSVFVAGAAVQWLRDGLGLIDSAGQIEALASQVNDSNGVYFVPAFTGLGSPYWDASARAAMLGIHRGVSRAHIARACLEAIAFQSAELALAMRDDSGASLQSFRVDGGAAKNNLLMQMQADLLGVPVVRPTVLESTARGAAALAGLQLGVFSSLNQVIGLLSASNQVEQVFEPQLSQEQIGLKMQRWREAVKRTLNWNNT